MRTRAAWAIAAVCILVASDGRAQGLTGTLLGTVKDEQGAVLQGARVHLSSPSLIGGPVTIATNERGQLRFPVLSPGAYVVDVELPGFTSLHEEDIRIGAGATLSRTVVLKVAGVAESIVVEGAGSRMEARGSGIETRFGPEYLRTIPSRRYSMFDGIQAGPGVSPTSPSSGTVNTVVGVRLGRQRKPVPHRRHEFHLSLLWRLARRAERRRHSGNPGPVGRRVCRVRQHPGHASSTSSPGRAAIVSSTTRRTTGRRPG